MRFNNEYNSYTEVDLNFAWDVIHLHHGNSDISISS